MKFASGFRLEQFRCLIFTSKTENFIHKGATNMVLNMKELLSLIVHK